MWSKDLICPKCGRTTVECDDCLNTDWSTDDKVVSAWNVGHCTNCGVDLQWDTIMKFDHYEIDIAN